MPTGGRVSPDACERSLGDAARSSRRLAWTLPDKAGKLSLDPEAPPAPSTTEASSSGQGALILVASALGTHPPPQSNPLTPAQDASNTSGPQKNPASGGWDAVRRNRKQISSSSKNSIAASTAAWAIAAMSSPLRRQQAKHAGNSGSAFGTANPDTRRGIRARQKEPTMRPQERLWRAIRDARETPGMRGWAIRRGIPLIGAALFCIDVLSDAVLAKNLFASGYRRLGILTVSFMFSHYIPTYIMLLRAANQAFFAQHTLLVSSAASVAADVAAAGAAAAVGSNQGSSLASGMARVLESLHLFYYVLLVIFGLPLLPILDAYMVLTAVILTTDRGNAGYAMRAAEDFCRQYERVRLPLECFLESLPQTALQVYLYIQTRSGSAAQAVQVSQTVLTTSLLGSILNLINVSWEMYNAWRASGDTLLEYLDALIRLQGSTKVPIEAQNAMLQRISDHQNRLSEHDKAAQTALGPAHTISRRRGEEEDDGDADSKGAAAMVHFTGLPPTMIYTLGGPGDTIYQALSAFQRRSLMDVVATPAKVRFANLRAVQLLQVDASVAARLLKRLVSLPPHLRLTGAWQGRRVAGSGGAGEEQGQSHQLYYNVITKHLPDAAIETDLASPLLDLHLSRLHLTGYYSGTAAVAASVGGASGSAAAINASTQVGRALGDILVAQPSLCRLVVEQCDVYARAMLEAMYEGMEAARGRDGEAMEVAVMAEAVAAAEEQQHEQLLAAGAANSAIVSGDIRVREEAWARRAALIRIREASGPRVVAVIHADGGADLEYWLEERARNAGLVVVGSAGTLAAGGFQPSVPVTQSGPSVSAAGATLAAVGNNTGRSGGVGDTGMGELRELHFVPNYRARMVVAESKVLLVPCPRAPGLMDLLSPALSTVLHPPRLTLSNTELRPEDTAAIGATLIFNRSIEGLEMRSCGLGSESLLQMLPGLGCHTTLNSLDLSSNPAIGDMGLEGLAGVLPHLPGLNTLILAKCGMGARGADAVAGQLLASVTFMRLSDLDLQDNKEECGTPALEWLCFTYQRRTTKQAKAPATRRVEVDEGGPIIPSFGLTGESVAMCLRALQSEADIAAPDITQQKDTTKAATATSTPDTDTSLATQKTLAELALPSDAAGDVAQLVLLSITAASATIPSALRLSNWIDQSSRSASATQGVLPPAPAALPGFTHPRGSVTLVAAISDSLLSLNPKHLRTLDLSSIPLGGPLSSTAAGPFAASGANQAVGGSLYLTPMEHLCLGLTASENLQCLRLAGCGLDDDAVVMVCAAAAKCPSLELLELHENPRVRDRGLLSGVVPLLQAIATGEDTYATDADEAKGGSGAVVARTAGGAKPARRSIGAARQGGSMLVVTADVSLGDEGLQESTVKQLLAAATTGWLKCSVERRADVSAATTRTTTRPILQLRCHDETTDSIVAELLALPRATPAGGVSASEIPAKILASSDDGVLGGRKVVARLSNDAHAIALALALCQLQEAPSTTPVGQSRQKQDGPKPSIGKQHQPTSSTLATTAAAAAKGTLSAVGRTDQDVTWGTVVRVLDLEGSQLGSVAVAALTFVLQHAPIGANLRCLRLVGCGLDDNAVVALCAAVTTFCLSLEEFDLQNNPQLRDKGFVEGILPLLQATASTKTNSQVAKQADDDLSLEPAVATGVPLRSRPPNQQLRVTASANDANGGALISTATMSALINAIMQFYGLGVDSSQQDGGGQIQVNNRELAPEPEGNAANGGLPSIPTSVRSRHDHENSYIAPSIQLILLGSTASLNHMLVALLNPPPKRLPAIQDKTADTAPGHKAADGSEAKVESVPTNDLEPPQQAVAPSQPQPPLSNIVVMLSTDGDALALAMALCQQHPRCAAALRVLDLSGSNQLSRVGAEVLCTALRFAHCGPYLQELLLSRMVDGVGDGLAQLLAAAVPSLTALRRLDVSGAVHVLSETAAEALVRALKAAAGATRSGSVEYADQRVGHLEEDSVEVLRLSDDERARAGSSFNGSAGDKAEAGDLSEDNEDADQDGRSVHAPHGGEHTNNGAEQGACDEAPQRVLMLGPLPPSVMVLRSLVALTAGEGASDDPPAKICVNANGLPPWTCTVWTGSPFIDSVCTAISTPLRPPAPGSTSSNAAGSPGNLTTTGVSPMLTVLPGIQPSTITAPHIMAMAWAFCRAARTLKLQGPDFQSQSPLVAILCSAGGAEFTGQGSEVAPAHELAHNPVSSADGPLAALILACNVYRAALVDTAGSPAAGALDRIDVVPEEERPSRSRTSVGSGNAGHGKGLVHQASSRGEFRLHSAGSPNGREVQPLPLPSSPCEHSDKGLSWQASSQTRAQEAATQKGNETPANLSPVVPITGVGASGGVEAWRSMLRSPAELPQSIAGSAQPALPEVEVAVEALADGDAAVITVALLAGWMGRDHHLDLAGCEMSEEGLRVLLHLLPLHAASLTRLSLSGLAPLGTSPKLQQALLSACLPALAAVTSLDLRGLQLPPGPLAEALAGMTRLKRVVVASGKEVLALRSTGRLPRGVKVSKQLTDTQHVAPVKEMMISVDLTGLNITPDGSTLLTADTKNNIHLFDAATGTCTATFDGVKQDGFNLLALHPSPDSRQMVCGSKDGGAWVFDLVTGTRVAVLPGHSRLVNCAVFSADGTKVVTCSYDKLVKVHDIATSTCIATLEGHSDEVNYIALSADGTRVASCADDGYVVIHDITDTTRAPVKFRPQQRIRGNRVAWHPILPHIAITSNNKTVQVIHAETGDVQVTFKGHPGDVTRVGWHPSGRLLASGCVEGQIRLWSPSGKACVAVLPPTPGVLGNAGVRGTVFTPDGRTLITASGRIILKWSVEPFMSTVELVESAAARRAAATDNTPAGESRSGDTEAEAGGPLSGAVVGWLSAEYEGSNAVCDELWPAHPQGLYGVSFSPDGRQVAAASKDCTARLFDVSQPGIPCITLSGDSSVVTCVATAPDASFAVTGGENGVLLLHRLPTGSCAGRLLGHETQTITCVAISPDGCLVASGSRAKGLLFVHDLKGLTTVDSKGLEGKKLKGHNDTIWAVAFAPNASRRLASCGQDSSVRFWSVDTGEAEATIVQDKPFNTIAFSPDGTRVFAADDKNVVSVYDVASKQAVMKFQNPNSFVSYIQTLALSRDGRVLASFTTGKVPGSTDTVKEQLVRLWNAATGLPVGMLPHPQEVTGVAFGPESLVTACWDGRVRVFSLDALINWEDWEERGGGPAARGAVVPLESDRAAGQEGTRGNAGGGAFWPMRLPLRLRCDTPVTVLTGPHTDLVWSVAFSPDSRLLLTTSRDGTVRLTHAGATWAAAATLQYDMPVAATSSEGDASAPTNDPFSTSTAFSTDGRMVAAGGGLVPVVRLWLLPAIFSASDSPETASQAQYLALGGHEGQVLAVAFSPDCLTLVSGGADTRVLLHDLSALKPGGSVSNTTTAASLVSSVALAGHTSTVLSVAFHPDGDMLAASGEDGSILFFSVRRRGVLRRLQVPSYAYMAACLRFSPTGHMLAACTVDGTVFLYNSGDGSHMVVLPWKAISTADEHLPVQTPPSKLDSTRAGGNVILRDEFTAEYAATSSDVGTVLANYPALNNSAVFYYEVKILSGGAKATIGLGFADKSYSLDAQPGWRSTSCGYHGDDGKYFYNSNCTEYGPKFNTGDVIGVGLLSKQQEVFYTKNGKQLAMTSAPGIAGMYPAIGLHSEGEKVYVNFGQDPFVFDLEAFKASIKVTPSGGSVPVTAENARPGLVVVRGVDWKWGDQDGGAGKTGRLTEPSSSGWYSVKWDNGGSYSYRIGGEDKYDLKTQRDDPIGDLITGGAGKAGEVVTRSNAAEGMKVVRGPNWKWGDQDGGANKQGKIILVKTDGWARVEWEHNKSTNAYRIGAEEAHDLQVVPPIPVSKLPGGVNIKKPICKMGRLVFAAAGEILIASAPDNLLRVWRLDGFGREMRTYCVAQLEGVKTLVTSLDIAPDGVHLAVSSMDKAVTLYDVVALLNG